MKICEIRVEKEPAISKQPRTPEDRRPYLFLVFGEEKNLSRIA